MSLPLVFITYLSILRNKHSDDELDPMDSTAAYNYDTPRSVTSHTSRSHTHTLTHSHTHTHSHTTHTLTHTLSPHITNNTFKYSKESFTI